MRRKSAAVENIVVEMGSIGESSWIETCQTGRSCTGTGSSGDIKTPHFQDELDSHGNSKMKKVKLKVWRKLREEAYQELLGLWVRTVAREVEILERRKRMWRLKSQQCPGSSKEKAEMFENNKRLF